MAIALAFAFGCGQGGGDGAGEPGGDSGGGDDEPTMEEPAPDEDLEQLAGGREMKRMDIDQLQATVETVTGGVGWTDEEGRDLFTEYADTLGEPDYIRSTEEDKSASVLFLKFVDDMARDVCTKLIDRERSGGGEHVFFVHADPGDVLPGEKDAVRKNMVYLLHRFHGETVTTDSEQLTPWIELFDKGSSRSDPPHGWKMVCVALIRHPHFYTY